MTLKDMEKTSRDLVQLKNAVDRANIALNKSYLVHRELAGNKNKDCIRTMSNAQSSADEALAEVVKLAHGFTVEDANARAMEFMNRPIQTIL
jgi:hypothetical protein